MSSEFVATLASANYFLFNMRDQGHHNSLENLLFILVFICFMFLYFIFSNHFYVVYFTGYQKKHKMRNNILNYFIGFNFFRCKLQILLFCNF